LNLAGLLRAACNTTGKKRQSRDCLLSVHNWVPCAPVKTGEV
jgi:hypothetical protein